MSRFATQESVRTKKTVAPTKANKRTKNLAGGQAYTLDPKMEVVSILTTSLLRNEYYRSADDTAKRLAEVLQHVDPLFAAKTAIFARNEYGIRSITHLTAAEVVNKVKGEEWVKDFIYAVVRRVDDMTEIVAAYLSKYGKPLPNSLKKGLAKSFDKFDRYQLAKYRGEGHAISLVDLVNLVHPRPTAKNKEALKELVAGTLRAERTVQTALSAAGKSENKEAAKKAAWNSLVSTGEIGYMALLMNLRNIEAERDKELIHSAVKLIEDPVRIKKSLILPFQFLSAYQNVAHSSVRNALDKAIEISIENMPQLPGRNLIAVDHSGSMGGGIGSRKFMADVFGSMLLTKTDADFMVFGDRAGYVSDYDAGKGILQMAHQLGHVNYGHGTNFNEIFDKASKSYDRIFIFSDMQSWMGDAIYGRGSQTALDQYKKRKNVDPFVYSFDLNGYGSSQFNLDGRHAQLPGISEKVFQLIGVVEEDREALIHKIEAVSF